jgi:hypothetical protein
VAATAYSFMRAPALVDAGRSLRSGQAAIARHDWVTAAAQLERARGGSVVAQGDDLLAEADVGADRPQAALDLPRGMKLSEASSCTRQRTGSSATSPTPRCTR